MGTLAQEILRKYHGLNQRPEIKKEVDAAQAKAEGKEKDAEKAQDEKPSDKAHKKDSRDLGDSAHDATPKK
jgi:hypothetical protein